tara:strand:+ start:1091 stop:1690 length:600 start_codon:yes stop_codon:yes gene_type:complete
MVNKVFKDIESTMKFLTSDGIPNAIFKNGKIVADGSKFDGLPANEKNINEMLDDTDYGIQPGPTAGDAGEQELYRLMIEVFKGNIVGQEAQQIMEAAQGEFPLEFIAREQQKYMQQPKASGGVRDTQIMPDGRSFDPNMNRNQQMNMMNPMPRATNPNNVDPRSVMRPTASQPSMRNVFEKDRERLLTMATMDKLGLLT